jgi:hypothetical protein
MDLYEILGIAQDSTAEQIKTAYKKLAQKHHPDKDTGDAEIFGKVKHAYDLLSDEEKRARYDETGDDGNPDGMHAQAMMALNELLMSTLNQTHDISTVDILASMAAHLNTVVAQSASTRLGILRKIEKYEQAVVRLKGDNKILFAILNNNIARQRMILDSLDNEIVKIHYIEKILESYKYEADIPSTWSTQATSQVVFTPRYQGSTYG